MKATEYDAMYNAEQRHWWYQSLRQEVIRWLQQRRPADRPLRLLDLGCGTGGMLRTVEVQRADIAGTGLDLSEHAIRYARQRTAFPLMMSNASNLALATASHDIVTCLDVLYTREAYPYFTDTLNDIYRVLRDDGSLIMQLPAFQFLHSQHDDNVHSMHRFHARELKQALRTAGFRRVNVYYRYNALFLVAFVTRFLIPNWSKRDGSHVTVPHPMTNRVMSLFTRLEGTLSRRLPFPFGLSVFAVADK